MNFPRPGTDEVKGSRRHSGVISVVRFLRRRRSVASHTFRSLNDSIPRPAFSNPLSSAEVRLSVTNGWRR